MTGTKKMKQMRNKQKRQLFNLGETKVAQERKYNSSAPHGSSVNNRYNVSHINTTY